MPPLDVGRLLGADGALFERGKVGVLLLLRLLARQARLGRLDGLKVVALGDFRLLLGLDNALVEGGEVGVLLLLCLCA